ncbi:MAG TPA: DUF29 domain-containing protein [Salinarimonas sp.]|nr:DUF29 domain-containing protein [Salinarimonas sp.]
MDERRPPDRDGLYETDFFRWTQEQAAALRRAAAERVNAPLDWENLAEEIESLGKRDRREMRSRIRSIIEHLAKLAASPAQDPREGWLDEVETQRSDLEQVLRDSPSLRRDVAPVVEDELDRGFKAAATALRRHGEPEGRLIPWKQRGFTPDEVLTPGWFPSQDPTQASQDPR